MTPLYEQVCDVDNLYLAYLAVRASSNRTEETQRYTSMLMPKLFKLSDSLMNHTYTPSNPRGFIASERGKTRYIESRCMNDKIVARSLHDNVIAPCMYPRLQYDNSASIPNRGVSFFRKRLLLHLGQMVQQYGRDFYVLVIDFKKFFDNIRHEIIINQFANMIPDTECMDLISLLVRDNKVDVSYMTDEEYMNCMNVPFNNLEYRLALNNHSIQATGQKFMPKYMSIGSQLSQDAGLLYPNEIDSYCKIVKGIKGYARYMDDIYIMHHSKEFLWQLLDDICNICYKLGIFINEKKTQLINAKHEFSILKVRYVVDSNNNIIQMPNSDTFKRERAKLKKQYDWLMQGKIEMKYIETCYKSWKGNIMSSRNNRPLLSMNIMNKYYDSLFIDPFINGELECYYEYHTDEA